MSDIDARYKQRRAAVAAHLAERGIAAARFEDFETMRDPSLRYLCGHPGDAFLLLGADGRSVLVPWDSTMASRYAHVDKILPYTSFGRRFEPAMRAALEAIGLAPGAHIEFSRATSYTAFIQYIEALADYDLVCVDDGVDAFVMGMRAEKDAYEVSLYRRLSAYTNTLMDRIENSVKDGSLSTELDIGLFIERELRAGGGEATGFDTIAAGPSRSFGIHAFPSFGAGPFGSKGMSILDFGIIFEGYTSDVTMSFARGPLHPRQEEMISLVQEAYEMGLAACGPGVRTRDVALVVDTFFAKHGYTMPHGLGHGIGLQAHEAPGVNMREDIIAVLKPGNIITIEPGLYDPELGGVRLENDILITETGFETLTTSRIMRL